MTVFKPMLAAPVEDPSALRLPMLASPKLDGIRCVIVNGIPLSRTLKPIPNRFVQRVLAGLPDLDGELIVGSPCNTPGGDSVMARTTSGVMSMDGEPEFTYHVFDHVHHVHPFSSRLECAAAAIEAQSAPVRAYLKVVAHTMLQHYADLYAYEEQTVTLGYEGVMLRNPGGVYKFGRSTWREHGLLKWKRMHDAEATVYGSVVQFHNANEAQRDNLGRTKRSTAKAGKVMTNKLGTLKCRTDAGVEFEIGTGFTDAQRIELWTEPGQLLGRRVKFKYQELSPDGVPRFPVFLGWRHADD